ASSNTITQSFGSNLFAAAVPNAHAVLLENNANYNLISLSTFVVNVIGDPNPAAIWLGAATFNNINKSWLYSTQQQYGSGVYFSVSAIFNTVSQSTIGLAGGGGLAYIQGSSNTISDSNIVNEL